MGMVSLVASAVFVLCGAFAAPLLTGPAAQAAPVRAADVYEDFLCPFCAQFDQQYGSQLDDAARSGKIKVNYHFVNKLDRLSASGDYSSRAAGAARCVENFAPARFGAFRDRLFSPEVQPQEEGDSDLSNGDLSRIATEVGAGAAASCVREGARVAVAKSAACADLDHLSAVGGQGVPSVVSDGKLVDLDNQNWLAELGA
jgi:protein-disulfide isomerase